MNSCAFSEFEWLCLPQNSTIKQLTMFSHLSTQFLPQTLLHCPFVCVEPWRWLLVAGAMFTEISFANASITPRHQMFQIKQHFVGGLSDPLCLVKLPQSAFRMCAGLEWWEHQNCNCKKWWWHLQLCNCANCMIVLTQIQNKFWMRQCFKLVIATFVHCNKNRKHLKSNCNIPSAKINIHRNCQWLLQKSRKNCVFYKKKQKKQQQSMITAKDIHLFWNLEIALQQQAWNDAQFAIKIGPNDFHDVLCLLESIQENVIEMVEWWPISHNSEAPNRESTLPGRISHQARGFLSDWERKFLFLEMTVELFWDLFGPEEWRQMSPVGMGLSFHHSWED